MAGIYLALGSNLGNRRSNLALALRMLEPLVRVEAVSALYESPPQPPAPPPPYLNCACRVVTGLSPLLLLRHVKRIEQAIGRRSTEPWAPRPIDIDIVLFNDERLETEELTIPHPRLAERPFVIQPLLDLDIDLVDHRTGEKMAKIGTRTVKEIRRVDGPDWASGATS
jgi:2-amino-4-hydroxy-6-hydroxymethyldihydropteridine diphosphokinase